MNIGKTLFFFFLSAPVYGQILPEWVDSPQKILDPDVYESASGSGVDREEAEKDAYAALARRFGTRVETSLFFNRSAGQETLQKTIALTSSRELFYVRTAASAEVGGRVYVLAALEKAPAASLLAKKIAENQDLLAEYSSRIRWETDPLRRYALCLFGLALARTNQDYEGQLRILNPKASMPLKPEFSIGAFRGKAEAARSFSFRTEGLSSGSKQAVELGLARFGLGVAGPLRYVLKGRYGLIRQNSDVRARWFLDLYNNEGERMRTFSFEAQASNEEAALRRLESALGEDFPRTFGDYLKEIAGYEINP